jgi:hypothetical protein
MIRKSGNWPAGERPGGRIIYGRLEAVDVSGLRREEWPRLTLFSS